MVEEMRPGVRQTETQGVDEVKTRIDDRLTTQTVVVFGLCDHIEM